MCGRKRIRFEDRRQRKGERGGFLKRIRVYIYIYRVYSAKVAMSSRPIGFHGTRYNKRPVVSFVRSSLSGGPIFSRLESVPFPARDGTLRPSFASDHVEKIGWTDFDRPIDSCSEIRKCLHASRGYNYFAPKSHEVRAMTWNRSIAFRSSIE